MIRRNAKDNGEYRCTGTNVPERGGENGVYDICEIKVETLKLRTRIVPVQQKHVNESHHFQVCCTATRHSQCAAESERDGERQRRPSLSCCERKKK